MRQFLDLHVTCAAQVTGWFTYWKPQRPFAMDMAGFAVNLRLILQHPTASFSNAVQRGYQESTLLTGLGVMLSDLEPKANSCTKVGVCARACVCVCVHI